MHFCSDLIPLHTSRLRSSFSSFQVSATLMDPTLKIMKVSSSLRRSDGWVVELPLAFDNAGLPSRSTKLPGRLRLAWSSWPRIGSKFVMCVIKVEVPGSGRRIHMEENAKARHTCSTCMLQPTFTTTTTTTTTKHRSDY